MEKNNRNDYSDDYNECLDRLAELTGFDSDYLEIDVVKKSNKNVLDFDIYEFNYKNKKYIYNAGQLNEIKENI